MDNMKIKVTIFVNNGNKSRIMAFFLRINESFLILVFRFLKSTKKNDEIKVVFN